jgi:hypothetical protein
MRKLAIRVADVNSAFRMARDEFVHHSRAKLVGVADENGEGVAV